MRQLLLERMEDGRSNRVIFVSHCLLNENTRYLGGAFRRGCMDEIVDAFQQEGLGIYQMRCPEQLAWGGVLKRRLLTFTAQRAPSCIGFVMCCFPSSFGIHDGSKGAERKKSSGISRTMYVLASRWLA